MEEFLIDNYLSTEFLIKVFPEMASSLVCSAFAITTVFMLITYGVFKAFSLVKSFT